MRMLVRPTRWALVALCAALWYVAAVAAWDPAGSMSSAPHGSATAASVFAPAGDGLPVAKDFDGVVAARAAWQRASTRRTGRELIAHLAPIAALGSNSPVGALNERGRPGAGRARWLDGREALDGPRLSRAPPALG